MVESKRLVSFLLRVGLALVFLYAATASFLESDAWVGFLPMFLRQIISPTLLLYLFSAYEIVLALWLLSGKKVLAASLFAAATLFAIIIQNFGALDIVFRDIAILFASLALAALHFKNNEQI